MAKKREHKESLYLSVVQLDNRSVALGQFVEQPTAESTVITTQKKGSDKTTQKNYVLFDEIEGKIKTVGVYDKEIESGARWEMTSITVINNEGTNENVQVNFKSRYSSTLITRLENIDLTKPVIVRAFRIKEVGKKDKNGNQVFNEMLLPYQKNELGELVSIKNKYAPKFAPEDTAKTNNLNPNQLPKFKQIEKIVKGAKVIEWETSEYEEALRQICASVDAKIRELNTKPVEVEIKTPITNEIVNTEDNDGFSF